MRCPRPLLAGLLALALPAAAEIFRCAEADGTVTYQQLPCAPGTRGEALAIATAYPDHTAARDRLAQREAAADARLMKRLEIEAAERIARDERIAREKELEAARERTRAIEQQAVPLVIMARPGFGHRPRARHRLPDFRR
jgi:hypothetical protein